MPKLNQKVEQQNGKRPVPKPKLVNRGPAGLLTKIPHQQEEKKETQATEVPAEINKIALPLKALEVDIETLTPDPENARVHPERNMDSIKTSLRLYGQLKPIVVQKWSERRQHGNIIVAGNGTWQAAKELGWTKIAASINDLTDVEAAGFGLADNRSAELAKWDFEVVARLDQFLQETQHEMAGWSLDELEVLRAADWTPPVISESAFATNGQVVEEEAVDIECPKCGHKWVKE